MDEQTLKNHVAIVTGASRGIGAETAIAFGHAGSEGGAGCTDNA